MTIKVFVIDDSAVVRQVLTEILSKDPAIRIAGTAPDPLFALQKMQRDWPDVIILDIEMPRMDGITFLKKLMVERPTPVVICSTLTEKGADASVQALAAGAVEVVAKPKLGLKEFLQTSAHALVGVVKGAALAKPSRAFARELSAQEHKATKAGVSRALVHTTDQVVACGTSTGGTQALETVLSRLSETCPGIVVVQHMPEKFTAAFAQRLNSLCRCEVLEARDGDRVLPGRVLIAPGGHHMQLRRNGAQYCVQVTDGPPVNRHKPSVDVLFRSVAAVAGKNALGIIMTGMGDDGARGLLSMRQAGAHTLSQDKSSCVVYGMPKEAVELGAVDTVLPLMSISAAIEQWAASRR